MDQPTGHACLTCGAVMSRMSGQIGGPRKYCSPECKKIADAARRALRRQGIGFEAFTSCQGCGGALPPRSGRRGSVQKWCSKNCRQRTVYELKPKIQGVCVQCGASFETHNSTKRFCSEFCCEVSHGMRLPAPLPERICALDRCDIAFQPKYRNQQCCCEEHGRLNWRVRAIADGRYVAYKWDDSRRAASQRRRALKAGASTGSRVRSLEIAERDGWRCHLCGKQIRQALKWPHPMSLSMDHVIPLSQGGPHDPTNVRAAHLDCNVSKGNRGGGEQLMLLG